MLRNKPTGLLLTAAEWRYRGRMPKIGERPQQGPYGTKLYDSSQTDYTLNVTRERMLNRTKRTG